MTVFCFKIRFDGDDDIQMRYVLARTEEQAVRKIEDYRKGLVERGFADLIYSLNPTVELENVIV